MDTNELHQETTAHKFGLRASPQNPEAVKCASEGRAHVDGRAPCCILRWSHLHRVQDFWVHGAAEDAASSKPPMSTKSEHLWQSCSREEAADAPLRARVLQSHLETLSPAALDSQKLSLPQTSYQDVRSSSDPACSSEQLSLKSRPGLLESRAPSKLRKPLLGPQKPDPESESNGRVGAALRWGMPEGRTYPFQFDRRQSKTA